jgi:hypothetical protein
MCFLLPFPFEIWSVCDVIKFITAAPSQPEAEQLRDNPAANVFPHTRVFLCLCELAHSAAANESPANSRFCTRRLLRLSVCNRTINYPDRVQYPPHAAHILDSSLQFRFQPLFVCVKKRQQRRVWRRVKPLSAARVRRCCDFEFYSEKPQRFCGCGVMSTP